MIELRGVSKRFGDFTAVHETSLNIAAGEFVTLLGPSGCGKTTLLRMLSGFESPDTGSVHIAGVDVTDLPPYRRNVNQVFQSYALFPHMSVRANIGFGLRMQKVPAAEAARRVDEVIALVALQGFEDRLPSQLSGGQRQRVALARAIVPRPAVLLLDEPLSALDAKLRAQMQLELKRLQRHLGMTFVFVTHDQEEALTMSDRIAVLNKGRLEQLGTAAEIYHRPRSSFVADFIGEANFLEAGLISRDATTARLRLGPEIELVVAAEQWPAGAARALVSVRPEKIHVSAARIEAPNVFAATVVDEVFQGVFDRLTLLGPGDVRFTAIVANESAFQPSVHVGDRVWCGLHADDITIIPEA